MSFEKAAAHLQKYGLAQQTRQFAVSSATVELAAQALGCREAEIAKTISFDVNGVCVLIVAAGDVKIDNARFKQAFHTKAVMLPREQAGARIGHEVGGVCPFGVNEGVQVYLDESLRRFDTVYPACGSSNSAVGLTLPQLEQCAQALGWVDVCKPVLRGE